MAYFAGMFALGFLLGTARITVLAPMLGDWGELPVMLAISWIYCGKIVRRFTVSKAIGARLLMGMFAFSLLMTAEVMLGVGLFERTLAQQLREMASGPAMAGLAAQLAFAIFPLVQCIGGR